MPNGKGRFWYFYSGGDFSTGSNVEQMAIDKPVQMDPNIYLSGTTKRKTCSFIAKSEMDSEWTKGNLLRHSKLVALRDDKKASEVTKEN